MADPNLEVFLGQMILISTAAQAVTEALKQTLLRKWLVGDKLTPEKLAAAAANPKLTDTDKELAKKELENKETLRQNVIRGLTAVVGIALAWRTGLDPFEAIGATSVEPVQGTMITWPEAIRYILVGCTAYFGAPMFNDLLNVVKAWREQKAKLAKEVPAAAPAPVVVNRVVAAAEWKPGEPVAPSLREYMIEALMTATASGQKYTQESAAKAVDDQLKRPA